jgi:putative endonuclease
VVTAGSARRSAERSRLASRAEELVARYLESQGFEIVERNARLGHLEIDIIARRRSLLVFCEVRARTNDRLMTPAQSVIGPKAERFRRAAAAYLAAAVPRPREVRLDVASVVYDVPEGRLDYYEAAL